MADRPTPAGGAAAVDNRPIGARWAHRPRPFRRAFSFAAMRLLARFVLLLSQVLGLSLAFAWAWDRSDPGQPAPAATNPS